MGSRRAFTASSERLAGLPGMWGLYTRHAFYQRVLEQVGENVHFGYMSLLSKPQASIGDRVYIGRFCTLGLAHLGNDVMLSDSVQILSGAHQHGNGQPQKAGTHRDQPQQYQPIQIGQGAWIGAGAIIMADVGEHAIVGAGAVVTRPVAAHSRVVGSPAKPIPPPREAPRKFSLGKTSSPPEAPRKLPLEKNQNTGNSSGNISLAKAG